MKRITYAVLGLMGIMGTLSIGVANANDVTFNSNGGSEVAGQTIDDNNLISEPSAPTLAGYHFLGWYRDTDFTSKWDFDTDVVTGNMTLYAKWGGNTIYRGITGGVLYISDSGNVIDDGTPIDLTTLSTKGSTGYDKAFSSYSSVPRYSSRSSITSVKVIGNVAPTSTAYWFYGLASCTSVDLSGLDTSNVTSMYSMFYNCSSLTSLDVSNFDTSNVTSMYYMFYNCSNLTSLDLSNFDTSKVTSYGSMLSSLSSLIDLNVSATLNNKISSTSLYNYPLNNSNNRWIYSGTEYSSRSSMVANEARHYLAKVAITYKDKGGANFSASTGGLTTYHTYGTETELIALAESGFLGWCTNSACTPDSKITSISADYRGNGTIYADWEGINTIYRGITGGVLYISDSGNVIDDGTPIDLTTLTNKGAFGDNVKFDSYSSVPRDSSRSSITSVKVIGHVTPTSTAYWFYGLTSCTSMDLSGLDTSNVTSMSYMFYNCRNLTSLDVSNFDTSNVTNMNYMFYSGSRIGSLDLSNFDTSKVTNYSNMLSKLSSLIDLNVSATLNNNISSTSLYNYPFNQSGNKWIYSGTEYSSISSMVANEARHYLAKVPITYKDKGGANFSASTGGLTTYHTYGTETELITPTGSGFLGWYTDPVCTPDNKITSLSADYRGNTTIYADWEGIDLIYRGIDNGTLYISDNSIVENDGNSIDLTVLSKNGYFGSNTIFTYTCTTTKKKKLGATVSETPVSCSSSTQTLTIGTPWYSSRSSITSVKVIGHVAPNSLNYWFYDCNNITSMDLGGLDVSNTTSYTNVWLNAVPELTDLNVSASVNNNIESVLGHYMPGCSSNICNNTLIYSGTEYSSISDMQANEARHYSMGFGITYKDKYGNIISDNNLTKYYLYGRETILTNPSDPNFLGWYTTQTLRESNKITKIPADYSGSITLYTNLEVDRIYRGIDNGTLYISDSTTLNDNGKNVDLITLDNNGSFGYSVVFASGSFAPWYSYSSSITSVKVMGNVAPTSTAYWFYNFTNCTSMDLSGLDTSNVTDMSWMFATVYSYIGSLYPGTSSLKSLDVSHFDTSNVTDMSYMFYGCSELTSLDVSNWNTSKVTDMSYMFYYCSSLESLDLSHFDTSNVTDMSYMFYDCSELTSLDVSNWNTSKVTNMSYMFYDCYALTSLDLSHFDTSNVTNMSSMFRDCSSLTSLDVGNWNTSKVTNMNYMFEYCSSLESLDLSHFDTSNVTSMSYMFYNCSNLTSLDVSNFNTSKVTSYSYMLSSLSSLIDLNVSATLNNNISSTSLSNNGWTYSGTIYTSLSDMQTNEARHYLVDVSTICTIYRGITGGVLYISDSGNVIDSGISIDLNTLTNNGSFGSNAVFSSSSSVPRYSSRSSITSVKVIGHVAPTSTAYWFYNFTNCESMDLSGLDTSNVTDMSYMFYYCNALTSLDVSHFDTSKVTNMSSMFYYCSSLTSLDLSHFDTSKVTDMRYMFYYCSSLTSLDVSHFDTSNVTSMYSMFYNCSSLTSLDVSNFDTSKVTSMYDMFYNCSSLESLNLSHFDTSKVTNMSYMLSSLSSLIDLNVSASLNNNISSTSLSMPLGNSNNRWIYSGTEYSSISSMVANEARHYLAKVAITYKDKGGANFSASTGGLTTYHTYGTETELITLAESGFLGWCTDSACIPNSKITSISADYRGNATIYADWEGINLIDLIYRGITDLGELYISDSSNVIDSGTFIDLTTLTNKGSFRYNVNFNSAYSIPWYSYRSSIKSVKVIGNIAPTRTAWWFYGFSNCTSMDLSGLNTSKVTKMKSMFYDCSSLTSLDVSNFDTSNVTDMSYMFEYCSSLTSLDLSHFDTSNVTSYDYMLYSLSSLIDLNVSASLNNKISSTSLSMPLGNSNNRWIYSGTEYTSTSDMQANEARHYIVDKVAITYKDKNGNTISDENFTKYHIYGTETILTPSSDPNFSGFYLNSGFTAESKITSLSADYRGKATIYADWEGIDLIYRGITGGILYISDSGNVIDSGISIDLNTLTNNGSFGYNVVFGSYSSIPWYSYRSSITSVKVIGNVTPTSTAYWFYELTSCTSMDLSGLDTSNVTDMNYMFYNCSNLTSLDVSHFDTSNVTDMRYMFEYCSKLTSLDVSHFDTSNVTNMYSMFYNCSKLTSLDVSNFDTSKVTDMSYMFYNCSSLTSLDVSHFDTSKVTTMSSMFYNCSNLTSLDLSHFDTSKVTNMRYMFYDCTLESLDLSHFNTSKVTSMYSMFLGCSNLTSLDLSHFDTSNVTNMSFMFDGCSKLTSLDVSHFDTSKVTSYDYMLSSLSSLIDLNVSASLNNNISSTDLSNNRWTYSGTEYTSTSDMQANEARHYLAGLTEGSTIYRGITGGVLYISDSSNVIDSGNYIDLTALTNKGSFGSNAVFSSSSSAPRYSSRSSITSVKVIGNVAPTSTAYWFYYLTNCTSMDLSGLDTSNVTSMRYMFYYCNKLTSLDLSHFDTSNTSTTSYSSMLSSLSSLVDLNVSASLNNNISSTSLSMPLGNSNNRWTYNGTDYSSTSSMKSKAARHYYAKVSITYKDKGGRNFTSSTGGLPAYHTYSTETPLVNLLDSDFLGWYTDSACTKGNKITSISADYRGNATIYAKWATVDYENDENDETGNQIYRGIDNGILYISNSGNILNGDDAIDLTLLTHNGSFGDNEVFDSSSSVPWYNYRLLIKSVNVVGDVAPTSTAYWFYYLTNCESMDLSGLDTSNVTSMYYMFYHCSSLTGLDSSNFNTSNVKDMSYMFEYCSSLESLDLSHFNTSKVVYMNYMFYGCDKLKSLNLSNFSTAKISSVRYMLNYLPSLVDLDVSADMNNKISSTYLNMPGNDSKNRWMYSGTMYASRTEMQSNETRHYHAIYKITYKDKGGNELSVFSGMLPTYHTYGINTELPVSIEGYATKWYTDSGCTENRITMLGGEDYTGAITLYADYSKYTITWKDGNTVLMVDEEVDYGEIPQYNGAKPKKGNYTFKGWSPEISALTGTETEVEYVAVWEVPQSSGGGGRRVVTETSSEKEEKNVETKDIETKDVETQEEIQTNETENDTNIINDTPIDTQNNNNTSDDNAQTYSEEMQEAFVFAHQNGITTMPSIGKADMEGGLTRIAMSKMLSQYAINVLGKTPADIEVPDFSDVTNGLDEQYNNGISLAYRLGIMGINIQDFRPYDEVTRAEFGTALSRLLFGLEDGGELYYETHLAKLTNEGIITNNDPDMKELRGYVMIMLMRSAM